MGIFVGDLAGDRLERETFFELFDAGHDPFDLSIAVQVRAADAHCSAVLHLFDRSAQVYILLIFINEVEQCIPVPFPTRHF